MKREKRNKILKETPKIKSRSAQRKDISRLEKPGLIFTASVAVLFL